MYAHTLRKFTFALVLALTGLSAWAQTDAERAQQAAREAAAKAAEGRRQAAINAAKGGMQPVYTKEKNLLAEKRAMKKARDLQGDKDRMEEEKDSIQRSKNWIKLNTWKRKLFVGAQAGTNFLVGDNITDHPPFRWGEAWGVGANVYAGMFIGRGFGVRASLSYQNVRSRMDKESIMQQKHVYSGHGFFKFNVLETNADMLFDVSGSTYSRHFSPFHACLILGTGLSVIGTKKLHGDLLVPDVRVEEGKKKGFIKYEYTETDKNGVARHKEKEVPSFENRVSTKAHALWTFRMGFLLDYRVSKHLSANMEFISSVSNDNFEGIKFDEPFDILLKGSMGMSYWF